jgi:hypothetical protein
VSTSTKSSSHGAWRTTADARDICASDTTTTDSTKRQLAIVHGPAILDGSGVNLAFPASLIDHAYYNSIVAKCVEQLAQRGIVLGGEPRLLS